MAAADRHGWAPGGAAAAAEVRALIYRNMARFTGIGSYTVTGCRFLLQEPTVCFVLKMIEYGFLMINK